MSDDKKPDPIPAPHLAGDIKHSMDIALARIKELHVLRSAMGGDAELAVAIDLLLEDARASLRESVAAAAAERAAMTGGR